MRCGRAAPHPMLSCTELGFQCPQRLLLWRWALTPPFHPYHFRGGLLSAALSMHEPYGRAPSFQTELCSTVSGLSSRERATSECPLSNLKERK